MDSHWISRRRLLRSAAGLGLGLAASSVIRADDPAPPAETFPKDAKEALQRLVAGNKRFVAEEPMHGRTSKEYRQELAGGQRPIAAILGCSDSRVIPEMAFDQGLGDLFVVRVAGNVVAADVLGSLQYAGWHLKVPLLVVMGHQSCGAVAAALEAKMKCDKEPEHIGTLIGMIEPGLKDLDPKLTGAAQVAAAVEANVRWSMAQLADDRDIKMALDEKRFELAGAVCQLETGAVRFLS